MSNPDSMKTGPWTSYIGMLRVLSSYKYTSCLYNDSSGLKGRGKEIYSEQIGFHNGDGYIIPIDEFIVSSLKAIYFPVHALK